MSRELIRRNVLILTVSMIVFFVMSLFVTARVDRKNTRQQLKNIHRIVSNEIKDADSDAAVAEAVNRITEEQKWLGVCVATTFGTIIIDSDSDAMGEGRYGTISKGELDRIASSEKSDDIYISGGRMFHIEKINEDVVLRTSVAMRDNTDFILENVFFLLILLSLMLAGSIFSTRQTTRSVVDAFNNITDNLRTLSGGNYVSIDTAHKFEEVSAACREINVIGENVGQYIEKTEEERDKVNYIINNVAGGIVIVDSAGKVYLANNYAKKAFGAEMETGRPITDYITDGYVLDLVEREREFKKELSADYRPAGGGRDYRITLNRFEREGTGELVSISMYDITDAKKEETRNREFISNASHELRTPITAINGFSELLLTGLVKDGETVREYVSNIYGEAMSMRHIVDELLYLSKLDYSDGEAMEKGEVRLDALVTQVAENYGAAAGERNVLIESVVSPVAVEGNESFLERMLANLVDNAVKYAAEHDGRVTVGCETNENGEPCLTVSDNGQGIAQEDISRIFERFYRKDASRSRDAGSTGLGLAIVQKVCVLHNAVIDVKSEKGKGSVFTVTFQSRE